MDAIKPLSSETSRPFSFSSTIFNWDRGGLYSAEFRKAKREHTPVVIPSERWLKDYLVV